MVKTNQFRTYSNDRSSSRKSKGIWTSELIVKRANKFYLLVACYNWLILSLI